MKKYLFPFLLLFALLACKKDYPDNVPEWLEKKIEHCKRTDDCCHDGFGLIVLELKNDAGEIVYELKQVEGYTIYDYDGNALCFYFMGNTECFAIEHEYSQHRIIWREADGKCS